MRGFFLVALFWPTCTVIAPPPPPTKHLFLPPVTVSLSYNAVQVFPRSRVFVKKCNFSPKTCEKMIPCLLLSTVHYIHIFWVQIYRLFWAKYQFIRQNFDEKILPKILISCPLITVFYFKCYIYFSQKIFDLQNIFSFDQGVRKKVMTYNLIYSESY